MSQRSAADIGWAWALLGACGCPMRDLFRGWEVRVVLTGDLGDGTPNDGLGAGREMLRLMEEMLAIDGYGYGYGC